MRRPTVFLVVAATWAGAGMAVAQTTTTTSTSTTSTSTTSTTVPAVPPVPTATLAGASGRVTGELGSYCWAAPPPAVTVCRHVDYLLSGPDPAETLTVVAGETLILSFATALEVASLTQGIWPSAGAPIPATNPTRFTAPMTAGLSVAHVLATFNGVPANGVSYFFELRVLPSPPTTVPPARPTGNVRISLTG